MPVTDAYDPTELAVLERQIDEWLGALATENDRIIAVDRDTGVARRARALGAKLLQSVRYGY